MYAGRGTYALPTTDYAVVAAVLANGFLSHASAAQIWDLDLLRSPDKPHVLIPNNRRSDVAGVVLHRAPRAETVKTVRRPWPVTTIERTLLDCARTLPFPEALAILDSALRKGRISTDAVLMLVDTVSGPGAANARRALAAADGRADSVGESATRAAALDVGLPPPELQCEIRLGPRSRAFTDLGWRSYRGRIVKLAVEFDGFGPHGSRDAFMKDRQRRNQLEGAGWALLEITMPDVLLRYSATGQMIKRALELRWRDARWQAAGRADNI